MYSLAIILIGLTELTSVLTYSDNQGDSMSNSMLAFCDGNYYVPKSRKSCNNGINFGTRPPKCVCIKGIYRMYLSNCEVADGFATEVCTLLEDIEQNITVKGVKLTREVQWDRTALVCEKGSGYNKDWDITAEGGTAHISSKFFYTINGDALSSSMTRDGKTKIQICVKRNPKKMNKICLYKHADNIENWQMEKSTVVVVPSKPECPEKKVPWTPMKARKCFDPLDPFDSECQSSCSKTNERSSNSNSSEQTHSFDTIEDANLDQNVTDPRPYNAHESNYLDRKLNTYWMLQETGFVNITPVNTLVHGPNNIFVLLELMKKITQNYCSSRFLPKFWVNQVVELFHVLHRGDILKYENELNDEEYKWIHDILTKCSENTHSVPLVPIPDSNVNNGGDSQHRSEECDFGIKKALGYCPLDGGCTTNQVIPTPPSDMYADYEKKHYVPEVTWLVLDIVHVICFPQFNESYRMFHVLEQTVEKLFTIQIKNYWFNPTWSTRTKRNMLGMAADVYMWNMEVCAQAAYRSNNNTVHRLVRPDPGKYISLTDLDKRKKRDVSSDSKLTKSGIQSLGVNVDVFCPKSKSQFKYPDQCNNMKDQHDSRIHKPLVILTK